MEDFYLFFIGFFFLFNKKKKNLFFTIPIIPGMNIFISYVCEQRIEIILLVLLDCME